MTVFRPRGAPCAWRAGQTSQACHEGMKGGANPARPQYACGGRIAQSPAGDAGAIVMACLAKAPDSGVSSRISPRNARLALLTPN